MSHPRFLFTARVVHATTGATPGIAWRLVGGNNHDLGRSGGTFADLRGCIEAVRLIQTRIDEFDADIAMAVGTVQWGWRLMDGADVLATSGRWYRRERECVYNLGQFVAAAPSAGIADAVGGQPPRRELLRPEFVLPHLDPVDLVHSNGDGDAAVTQDLPADQVDELTEAS